MARDDAAHRRHVRAKYNGQESVWEGADDWHLWNRQQIEIEVGKTWAATSVTFRGSPLVVDVGSAGDSYGIETPRRIDIDIAEKHLPRNGRSICANAENLPLVNGISDFTVCVGPVVNYCSLEEALGELSRITKRGCQIVLHVELSNSWEFFGTRAWRADAAFVETFYKGAEAMWVYSDGYVRRMAGNFGLKLERARYFHFLSSACYRLIRRPNLAAKLAPADPFFRLIPGASQVADSSIYVFRRED